MAIKTLIIEDEIASQQLLSTIIREYCPSLKILDIISDVETSIQLLSKINPDLVFMDIHLADKMAFDILDTLDEKDFYLIFTTAHEEYAIKAFDYEAIDYILKPYSPKQVIKAVDKVNKYRHLLTSSLTTSNVDNHGFSKRISLNTNEGITLVNESDIVSCEADGAYCTVYTSYGTKIVVSKPLIDFECQVDKSYFMRAHTSHLVNISHIRKFLKEDGGVLIMSDGSRIPVSRRKKQDFLDKIRFG